VAPRNHDLNSDERKRLTEALKASPAYRISWEDQDFLNEDVLRPIRLELELLKPELALRRHHIHTCIVVFGSARTLPPDVAARALEEAIARRDAAPADPDLEAAVSVARKQVEQSRYYEEARRFSRLVSKDFTKGDRRDFVIFTGGGPGVMEAANRGADDVGAMSAGLNIGIESEQEPNPYITPALCFQFHYFALRKMHFLMRAKALVAFPGGFGTMDELFEALTLVQTSKMPKMPIVLVGAAFWRRAVSFDFLVEQGVISPEDTGLFTIVETAEEAVAAIYDYYGGGAPEIGREATY
jgi:uncharacterized protein (TIGR00730 family)